MENKVWKCPSCGEELGIFIGGRLRIYISRNRKYIVSLPAMTTCPNPKCREMVEIAEIPNSDNGNQQ